ncbi:PREDICTED: photosynthetic NDH subunit of subcomplex B 2, chloroplastic [Fragaria vesca subsp. vesca]|uniref:photosynthetic NDH subunit of subcomplex B 2, chloroplastic n=1 Tax=Fragaria vesca subsp. vesca TaxID=101020 RepID=UPI0002C36515|nr:PREDICTED: photosynthetic NDH subunit of subcomplex B 2, chloroplastic [Fragaria vesca subsp. vesca]XP_011467572.1 PREDICTED: photosynthetic NDH subunit of subcomplex B 2, chloroplastic [Fragaria vesca subsp. vesca]XP_011467576.1 PREDICTED: photosynthetic NDH subunit of subcomplex B 2, chloroplastic [Fragaria vesca subsp. vesca]
MAMATMASSPFLFSKFRSCSCTGYNKRVLPLRVAAVASIPFQQPINVDYLEQEFGGHGVIFQGIGGDCVAKMSLDNGSKAILMLPSGLIASYKATMWHGGTVELLQSSVSQEANTIQGGVSVALECLGEEQVSWSPSNWALHDITGSPQDSIRVELMSTDSHDMVQVKYIVTLQDNVLISQLMVSNNSDSSSLQLSGYILSHLTVSSPDATFAVGLERSDFFGRLPILTSSAIIPPDYGQKSPSQFSQLWKQMASNDWGPKNGHQTKTEQEEEMEEGEEDDNYKNLREQMCRIYTSAPRDFTIIDRGRRNSVVVGRDGFEELYIFSPGSSHEYYSEYAFVCVGQSAVLNPIILGPKESWTGGQRLHNPNL